jgi:shikimate kinase
MKISLIGMSNIGKSYCSRNLAAHQGFKHVDCDALIEKKMSIELTKDGCFGTAGMAKWMGFPADPTYENNSRRYIECEEEVMKEAIAGLPVDTDSSVVLDTTGSVIYASADVLKSLRQATRVIYFEATEGHTAALFKSYISHHPKPVIWGDSYKPIAGEAPRQTLERCYLELLRDRAQRYKEIAHITIPFEQLKKHWTDIGAFVLKHLEQT